MKIVIVLPTYNERDNVGRLIRELQRQFLKVPAHEFHILVVDDNSPDGTAEIVRWEMRQFANLHLLSGTKAGLGAAYVRGMKHAMAELGAEAVFEMDADFSHDPADIPRLVAALDEGADFVIGSRYVPGGSIPKEWSFYRRMNSRYGNLVARYLAGIPRIRDCTAGFRAIRTVLLRRINLDALGVQGYAFQVALLHEAVAKGARIKEIPVHFVDRTRGMSKLGLRDIFEFIGNAAWIRLQRSRLFIKFCVVGASGVAVNLGVFTWLLAQELNRFLASPIAIEVSILWNFLLNNFWTFSERDTRDRVEIRALKFNAVSFLALGLSYSTFVLLSWLFPQLPPQIPQLAGIIPATLVNYFMNSYWTFREARASSQDLGIEYHNQPE